MDGRVYDLLEAFETSLPTLVVKDLQDFGNFAAKELYDSVPGHAVRGFVHGLWDSLGSLAQSTGIADFGKDTAYQLEEPGWNDGSYERVTRDNKIKTKLMSVEEQLAEKIVELPPTEVRKMRDYFKSMKNMKTNGPEQGPEDSEDERLQQIENFRDTLKKYDMFNMFFTTIPRKSKPQETKVVSLDRPSKNKYISRFQDRVYNFFNDVSNMYEVVKESLPNFNRPEPDFDPVKYEKLARQLENPSLLAEEYQQEIDKKSAVYSMLLGADMDTQVKAPKEPEIIKVGTGNVHKLNVNKGQHKPTSIGIGGNKRKLGLNKRPDPDVTGKVWISGKKNTIPKSRSQQMKSGTGRFAKKTFPGKGRRSSMKPNI